MSPVVFSCLIPLATLVPRLQAQLVVKLSPQTVSEFDHYAQGVEATLQERWSGKKNFLSIDDDPATKQRVLSGELFIKQMNNGQPVEIASGLIHDWLGAIYMPNTSIQRVLDVLEDSIATKTSILPSPNRAPSAAPGTISRVTTGDSSRKGSSRSFSTLTKTCITAKLRPASGRGRTTRATLPRWIPAGSAEGVNFHSARGMDFCGGFMATGASKHTEAACLPSAARSRCRAIFRKG